MIEIEVHTEVVLLVEEGFVEEKMQIEIMDLDIERIEDLGDNLGLEKDKKPGPHPVLGHVLV